MRHLEDIERSPFREIGNNSFLEFSDDELKRLAEIGTELKLIIVAAQKRIKDRIEQHK